MQPTGNPPAPDRTAPVTIVTGGSRGIGLGITRRLLTDGHRITVLATSPAPGPLLDELADLGEVTYVQGSVAEPDDHLRLIEATLHAYGRIDNLVNNAGVAPLVRDDILDAGLESYDRVMTINLRGPYFLTQAVARHLIVQRGDVDPLTLERPCGAIVNVSSVSATHVSLNRGEYCLSKAGVAMATQLWAARLAPEGIVVNEVRPGVIATDMTAGVKDRYDTLFSQGVAPMRRWGQPRDVAGAVSLLLAGDMPYSTGDVIHVDGGMHIPTL